MRQRRTWLVTPTLLLLLALRSALCRPRVTAPWPAAPPLCRLSEQPVEVDEAGGSPSRLPRLPSRHGAAPLPPLPWSCAVLHGSSGKPSSYDDDLCLLMLHLLSSAAPASSVSIASTSLDVLLCLGALRLRRPRAPSCGRRGDDGREVLPRRILPSSTFPNVLP
ncbi:hypothetical protein BS78_07G129200 [Paspalum vaginatum]|nr:hypothetical protein BS78_07G129200 [Paspalum vaginatum]